MDNTNKSTVIARKAGLTDKQKELLAQRLSGKKKSLNKQRIPKRNATKTIPLSYGQRSLWVTWQLDQASNAYNMSGVLKISGELNKKAIKKSLTLLLERHEILRTCFIASDDNEAQQCIQNEFELPWSEHLFSSDLITENQAKNLTEKFAKRPFDLENELPFKACLISLSNDEHQLALNVHHIVADGWSLTIMLNELMAIYSAVVTEQPITLPELPIQFADFSVWQKSWLDSGELTKQLAYWQTQLANCPASLPLPYDRKRQPQIKKINQTYDFYFSGTLTQQIKNLVQQSEATLYMGLLALFKLTLFRLSGQSDLCIGSPIVNRTKSETHGLIGYLTNVQVLRTKLDWTSDFIALLHQVRTTVLAGQTHQNVPFDMLVDALKPERISGVHPLFQVKCTQQAALPDSYHFSDLEMQLHIDAVDESHFDLSFDFTDTGSEIAGVFNYDSSLFEASTV
ncbi:hypothetical protein J3L16_07780, partial [Alteromonas sp. 5E99-2]|uniref:condensation domain-containing protein n=1 Tax=Alteromonas sp. 5E99-2 TaxID=2817683 RepID=UPI001AD57512